MTARRPARSRRLEMYRAYVRHPDYMVREAASRGVTVATLEAQLSAEGEIAGQEEGEGDECA